VVTPRMRTSGVPVEPAPALRVVYKMTTDFGVSRQTFALLAVWPQLAERTLSRDWPSHNWILAVTGTSLHFRLREEKEKEGKNRTMEVSVVASWHHVHVIGGSRTSRT
jgi:hypothetical protein